MVNWVRCQLLGGVTTVISSSLSDFQESKEFSVLTRFVVRGEKAYLCLSSLSFGNSVDLHSLFCHLGCYSSRFQNYYLSSLATISNSLCLFHNSFIAFQLWTVWKHDMATFMCNVIWCLHQISYRALQRQMDHPSKRTYMSIWFCEFLTSCLIFHHRFFLAPALKLA